MIYLFPIILIGIAGIGIGWNAHKEKCRFKIEHSSYTKKFKEELTRLLEDK